MTISLLCPNGHELQCPETLAGKRGKCPRCGATFRVPMLPAPAPEAPAAESAAAPPAEEPAKPAAEEKPSTPEAPGDVIKAYAEGEEEIGLTVADRVDFLCPNGHRLHGPASLVGQPGQCPTCGIRFLVPSPDDVQEEEEQGSDIGKIFINVDTGSKISKHGSRKGDSKKGDSKKGKSGLTSHDDEKAAAPSPPAKASVLPGLFSGWWDLKKNGIVIELHLGEGKIVIPDQYSPSLSQQSHGIFAIKEANGSYTLTALAWDSIRQVAVKGLRQLPAGMFDETA